MISHLQLTIRELRVRAVKVPMPRPLQTSGGTVGTAPLVRRSQWCNKAYANFQVEPMGVEPTTSRVRF